MALIKIGSTQCNNVICIPNVLCNAQCTMNFNRCRKKICLANAKADY